MSPRQSFASALHLFVIFFFFVTGSFFLALPHLPEARLKLENFLTNRFSDCSLIGSGFLLAGFVFLIGFYWLNQGRYLRIKMGSHSAEIDSKIIRETLDEYFKGEFSRKISLADVEIAFGSEIEIGVFVKQMKAEDQEELLANAEKGLNQLLRQRFGYSKPFYLVVKV